MKITPRALVMGSALVLAGGWFVFDYFGDQLGFGSPVKPGIGPAKSTAAEPIKTSGGTSETQLAMINSLSGISLASLAQTARRQPPAINNDDSDSDGGDDQPQAVSRLERN